jgi:hypothetical protein
MAGLMGILGALLAASLATPSPAGASDVAGSDVHVGVVVNGQAAASSSDARPAQISPNRPTLVRIIVTNGSDATIHVATVRFEGQVLGLPLFSYDSAVELVVPPGTQQAITFPVNMNGVGGQATGLIVATVTLINPAGYAIASQTVVTKVHGSLVSIYGMFALAVLVLTISSLVMALIMLVRHRLPQNRWLRAVRFFVPGFGVGLILTFTLAASGLFTPGAGHWLPLIVIPSAAGLLVGFLTPPPDEEEYDDYDPDVLLAEIVMVDEEPVGPSGDGVRVTADPARQSAGTAIPMGPATVGP